MDTLILGQLEVILGYKTGQKWVLLSRLSTTVSIKLGLDWTKFIWAEPSDLLWARHPTVYPSRYENKYPIMVISASEVVFVPKS